MLPDTTSHILHLVTTALDECETVAVPATVRRAWRIARLRGDLADSFRFAMELGVEHGFAELGRSGHDSTELDEGGRAYMAGRTTDVEPALLGFADIKEFTLQPIDKLASSASRTRTN